MISFLNLLDFEVLAFLGPFFVIHNFLPVLSPLLSTSALDLYILTFLIIVKLEISIYVIE